MKAATAARFLLAFLFMVAGSLHFLFPAPYIRIVSPFLPLPRLLVFISGIAEIAGGAGLLVLSSLTALTASSTADLVGFTIYEEQNRFLTLH